MLPQMAWVCVFWLFTNIPLCDYTTTFWFIHQFWAFGLFPCSGNYKHCCINQKYRFPFELLFLYPLGMFPNETLLGEMVAPFSVVWSLKSLYTAFHSSWTILHSHQQFTSCPFFSVSRTALVVACCFVLFCFTSSLLFLAFLHLLYFLIFSFISDWASL